MGEEGKEPLRDQNAPWTTREEPAFMDPRGSRRCRGARPSAGDAKTRGR
jgi:hypothetical protein